MYPLTYPILPFPEFPQDRWIDHAIHPPLSFGIKYLFHFQQLGVEFEYFLGRTPAQTLYKAHSIIMNSLHIY